MTTTQSHVSARQAAALLNMDDRTLRRAIQRKELAAKPGATRNSPARIEMADLQAFAAANGITLHANGHQVDANTGEVIAASTPIGAVVELQAAAAAEKPARRAPGTSSTSSEWIERAIRSETRLSTLTALVRAWQSTKPNDEGVAMIGLVLATWEAEA